MKVEDKLKTKVLQSETLETKVGQVFNGNTAEFIYRVNRYTLYKSCMVVKCKADNGYSIDRACSYDGGSAEAIGVIFLQNVYDEILQHGPIGECNGWGRFIQRL